MTSAALEVALGDVLTFRNGQTSPERDIDSGEYPVFGSNGPIGWSSKWNASGPVVVIGRVGSYCGSVYLSESNAWVTDNAIICSANDPRETRYWFYALSMAKLNEWRGGSGQPLLNQSVLRAIQYKAVPSNERFAVAEALGALDDKIAANNRACSLSAQMIASLYQRLARTEGVESVPLFDVIDVEFGEAFKGDKFTEPGVGRPLIRIRDLKTYKPQTWTTEERSSEVMVQPGDVVVGMDAEFRATWWIGRPGLLNQRVCRMRSRVGGAAFVAECVRTALAAIEREKSATTVIHLNKSDLARSVVELPKGRALTEFEDSAEPLVEAYVAHALENRTLARTRDELLPLLMSGKVHVKEAGAVVSDAL